MFAAVDEELDGPEITGDDSMNPLWGLTEASIVDSLMWGKHEKQFALPIEHLEAHCEIYGSSCRHSHYFCSPLCVLTQCACSVDLPEIASFY